MPAYAHPANPSQPQPPTIQLEPVSVFFQSKTIETVAAFETWITWSFTSFYSPKERLEGFI